MLEGSFWELALIFIIALIVFGPEKLPGVARTVGLWVGRARGMVRNLTDQLERELAAEEMRKAAADAKRGVNAALNQKIKLDDPPPPADKDQSGTTVKRDDSDG